jgi:SMI1/KNR4 family protein SUKH-1
MKRGNSSSHKLLLGRFSPDALARLPLAGLGGNQMEFNWRVFLEQFSKSLLEDETIQAQQSQETLNSGWLGFPGASLEAIKISEKRLGVEFPPSYRQFLQISDGWRNSGGFIDRIWSTNQIAWFRERHQEWIDAYTGPPHRLRLPTISDEDYFVYGEGQDPITLRVEYLQTALEISDIGDAGIYLLNPKVLTKEGEWEAWFFANWLPGAARYRSFQELMEAEYRSFLSISK